MGVEVVGEAVFFTEEETGPQRNKGKRPRPWVLEL
jgi:hypothetical protein